MTENNFQIDSASISDRGLSEKRPQNEDSFLELSERGLFVVADGVGGAQAGDVASQMAVELLGEAFTNLQQSGDAEDLMKIAIERANEAIYQMSHDLAQLSTMATTVVALHVAGNIATIGHVGDSRIYRLDPKGNLYRETQDHSVVEEEVRAGRMTAEQAVNHPSRNVISRALGAEHQVEVDMKTIMIEPNTTFLLCSDGITRHIDDFQLRELLMFNDTPVNLCKRMKEICYERGAEDNLTAVITRISEATAGNSAANVKWTADFEESTVTTARPQTIGSVAAGQNFIEDESPTQPLAGLPTIESAQTVEARSNNNFAPIVNNDRITSETRAEISEKRAEGVVYQEPLRAEQSNGGIMSRLLSLLLFLLLGALIGAGLYYVYSRNSKPLEIVPAAATNTAPPLTQMQSSKPEYESFETLRRSVDGNPNAYINTSADTTQDAEGLYLLGRAYLLTAKYPEAKKSLEEARNKLAQSNTANSKILATDIALGLAIVDEWRAQNKFQNQLNAGDDAPK